MSFSKLTESELQAASIASLSLRPSAPSLYDGRSLSATELRAAFDRLPRLIAERFNGLIDSLGLEANDAERLSEAIATGLFEGHSLEDLFLDIENGSFAAYLSTDGLHTLAEALEELYKRTRLPVGSEDLLSYVDAPRGLVAAEEPLPVSGAAVKDAIAGELTAHGKSPNAHSALIASLRDEMGAQDTLVYSGAQKMFRLMPVTNAGAAASYRLFYNAAGPEGTPKYLPVSDSALINIPRDMVVESGEVCLCTESGKPLAELEPGDRYIDLALAGTEGKHLYINVASLVNGMTLVKEGEGDLVTDVEIEGCRLTVGKYAAVSELVRKEELPLGLDARLGRLEEVSEGTLVAESVDDGVATVKTVPSDTVGVCEITRIGGVSYPTSEIKNNLSLSGIAGKHGDLTITYDKETGILVFDGEVNLDTGYIDIGGLYSTLPLFASLEVLSGSIEGDEVYFSFNNSSYMWEWDIHLPRTTATVNRENILLDSGDISSICFYCGDGATFKQYTLRITVGTQRCLGLASAAVHTVLCEEGKGSLLALPTEILSLKDYGDGLNEDCCNELIWEPRASRAYYRQAVARCTLSGTENFSSATDADGRTLLTYCLEGTAGETRALRALCSHFPYDASGESDESICCAVTEEGTLLRITTRAYTDAEGFSRYLAEEAANGTPVCIVYELETARITDVAAWLPASNRLAVTAGDTLRAVTESGKAPRLTVLHFLMGGRLSDIEARLSLLERRAALRSWQDVQSIVRAGLASVYFRIGDVLFCEKDGRQMAWTVIGIDTDTPADERYTHSLTLQAESAVAMLPYNEREAMLYAPRELAAGKYTQKCPVSISNVNGGNYYTFTFDTPLPAGAQIVSNWTEGVALDEITFAAYQSKDTEEPISISVADGTGGSALSLAGEINDWYRVYGGQTSYADSRIKAWLNSRASATALAFPENGFTRPTVHFKEMGGFLRDMDEDFLSAIGSVKKQTLSTDGEVVMSEERVFLLSPEEVHAPLEGALSEGSVYPYYANGAASYLPTEEAEEVRIRQANGESTRWLLRSPTPNGYTVRAVDTDGSLTDVLPTHAIGILPACCIV